MNKAIKQIRQEGYPIDEEDLKSIWPTRFGHINVYGRYLFNRKEILRKNRKLRQLRKPSLF